MAASIEDILAQLDSSLEEQALLRQEAQEITERPIGDDFLRERAATPVSRETVNLLQSTVGRGAPNVAALAAGFLSTQVDARDAAAAEINRQREERAEALQGVRVRADIDSQVNDLLQIGEAQRRARETESVIAGRQAGQALAESTEERLLRESESLISGRTETQRLSGLQEERLGRATDAEISSRQRRDDLAVQQEARLVAAAESEAERRELLNRLTRTDIDISEQEGRLFRLSNQAQKRKKVISDQLQLEAARQGLDFDQIDQILQQRLSNDAQLRALESEVRSLLSGGAVTREELAAEILLREGERSDAVDTEGFDPFAEPPEDEEEPGFFSRLFGRRGGDDQ